MNKLKEIFLSNRFTSFYWRTGMMFLAGMLNLLVEGLSGFGLNPTLTVLLGLVLGELSKAIANAIKEKETLNG